MSDSESKAPPARLWRGLLWVLVYLSAPALGALLCSGLLLIVRPSPGRPPPEPPEVGRANLWTIEGLPEMVDDVTFAPGRPLVAARSAGRLLVWGLGAGRPKPLLEEAAGERASSFTFTPDGSRLLASFRGHVRSWPTDSWRSQPADTPLKGGRLAFSPDGRRVGSVLPGKRFAVWEGKGGWRLLRRGDLPFRPIAIALWEDADSALLASENEMAVVDLTTGRIVRQAALSPSGILRRLRLVPGRREVATLVEAGNSVDLWRLPDLTPGRRFEVPVEYERVLDFAFSPDGKMVATVGYRSVKELGFLRVWDTDSGRLLSTLRPRHNALWSVAWSSDGGLIATGGELPPYTVRGWDVKTILSAGEPPG